MKIILLAVALSLTGCAQIQDYKTVDVALNTSLSTSIGGSFFNIAKTKDLPNAFGKADIYGGKVNIGHSELRYQGLTKDNQLILRYTDVTIHSDENVFTRYGNSSSTISSGYNGNITVTHAKKRDANISQLPPNTIEFLFPLNKKVLPIGDYIVTIIDATPYDVKYTISQ